MFLAKNDSVYQGTKFVPLSEIFKANFGIKIDLLLLPVGCYTFNTFIFTKKYIQLRQEYFIANETSINQALMIVCVQNFT